MFTDTFTEFYEQFKTSLSDGTFAKLTFAKTIGNTELKNIYIRPIMDEDELKLELKNLAAKIKKITPASKIYLFGSYAYGTPTDDSDIDLCILTDENRRKLEILREIRRNIGDVNYPLDILIYKTDEFNERVNNRFIMESKIYKDGVEII